MYICCPRGDYLEELYECDRASSWNKAARCLALYRSWFSCAFKTRSVDSVSHGAYLRPSFPLLSLPRDIYPSSRLSLGSSDSLERRRSGPNDISNYSARLVRTDIRQRHEARSFVSQGFIQSLDCFERRLRVLWFIVTAAACLRDSHAHNKAIRPPILYLIETIRIVRVGWSSWVRNTTISTDLGGVGIFQRSPDKVHPR